MAYGAGVQVATDARLLWDNSMKQQIKQWILSNNFRFTVLQELRHELHLLKLRAKNRLDPRVQSRLRELAAQTDLKVHFGCGSRILSGWVNIDAYPTENIDLLMDLREPLPFSDSSVRYLFTEHVLEHIESRYMLSIAREYHRVLQPGGAVRIIVPSLRFYCAAYMANDVEKITTPLPGTKSAAEAINSVFSDHFHRYIYDFETMAGILRQAGFRDVVETEYGESAFDELGVDSRQLSREVGSLCIEAQKEEP